MFMTSHAEVPFKRITLYKQGLKAGWFYCPLISEGIVGGHGGFFHEFDVMKYIPKILNNIALDSGNKITQSIPLGHLGDFNSMYTPQRFVEQAMAFDIDYGDVSEGPAHTGYAPHPPPHQATYGAPRRRQIQQYQRL